MGLVVGLLRAVWTGRKVTFRSYPPRGKLGRLREHVTQDDPERKARLMKELDGFLERDRDRELFDLAPLPQSAE